MAKKTETNQTGTKTKIAPEKKAPVTKKPVVAVISKADKIKNKPNAVPLTKTPAQEATPEKFAQAKKIVLDSPFYSVLSAWYKEQILLFFERNDHFSFLIATTFELAENQDEVNEVIENLVRPEKSFLNIQSPCPLHFMQRDQLYVNGINCDVKALSANKDFWWQPVTNLAAIELAYAVKKFGSMVEIGSGVNFCSFTNADISKSPKSLAQLIKERTDLNQ